jgi:hypothetical protein
MEMDHEVKSLAWTVYSTRIRLRTVIDLPKKVIEYSPGKKKPLDVAPEFSEVLYDAGRT